MLFWRSRNLDTEKKIEKSRYPKEDISTPTKRVTRACWGGGVPRRMGGSVGNHCQTQCRRALDKYLGSIPTMLCDRIGQLRFLEISNQKIGEILETLATRQEIGFCNFPTHLFFSDFLDSGVSLFCSWPTRSQNQSGYASKSLVPGAKQRKAFRLTCVHTCTFAVPPFAVPPFRSFRDSQVASVTACSVTLQRHSDSDLSDR